ncbi:MAG: fimbrillin family protein [Muribaculaceae bacterium]|nr:fimbrillin family protein [Muribaculaceae bacterium]MDE6702776.1 fimbrillin family protein [Muribaculaceae bacterium]
MMFDKIIYSVFAAAAIGALAACTSSTETEELQSAQVQFRASEISRSSLTTAETIKESSFAVYGDMVSSTNAAATPTVVFDGTEVKYADGVWSYSNPQYWFPGQTYSFVALHPATPAGIEAPKYENNSLSFKYTSPTNYTEAVDMLVAAHRRQYKAGNPHAVAFGFGHIMARLNFVAKLDPNAAASSMVIRRLALVNVSTKATYSIQPAMISVGTETDDFIGGWSDFSEPTGTLFEINNYVTVPAGGQQEIFPIENPLLVIPQNLSQDIKVEITYSRSGTDPNPIIAEANLFAPSIVHGGVWQAGQTYTYTFTLGNDDYITFDDPTVQDWNEAEGANYVVTD